MKKYMKQVAGFLTAMLLVVSTSISVFAASLMPVMTPEDHAKDLINMFITFASGDQQLAFIENTDEAELTQNLQSMGLPITGEALKGGVLGMSSTMKEYGEMEEVVEVTSKETDDLNILTAKCKFTNKDVFVDMSFAGDTLVSVTYKPVLTMGEIAQKAGINTLLGMGTVVCILMIIALIIYLFKYMPCNKVKEEKKVEPEAAKETAPVEQSENLADDKELVAVIAAAIASYEGMEDASGFTVREIRRNNTNLWE